MIKGVSTPESSHTFPIYNLLPNNEVLILMCFNFIYVQLRLQPITDLLMSLSDVFELSGSTY